MEKLYWKTIHNVDFSKEHDFLESVLTSNGITDIYEFLHVNETHTHDPFLFKNVKEAVQLLHKHLNKGKTIVIKVDPDVDGYTSAAVLNGFIKTISPETELIFLYSFNKEHGVFLTGFETKGIEHVDLVIIPDAGSGKESIEEYKKIKVKYDCDFLTIDHHDICPEINEYTCLVNCMDGQYPNPTLSGVGVVYKFLIAYCATYEVDKKYADYYLDLVSLGMVSDSMDMRNLETRYYALEGLKEENRHNLLIQEIAERFADDMKLGFTLDAIGWTIAPKMNGTIRYGTEEEQIDLFRALCGEKEDREYQPRKERGAPKDAPKPPLEIHSLQKTMARVCGNVKNRQDNAVRDFMKELDTEIQKQKLYNNSVIIIDATNIVDKKTVTGLVANKLAELYKRPILILKAKDEDNFGGSGRNYDSGSVSVEDLKKFLNETGLIACEGHAGAFGVTLAKDNVESLTKACNNKLKLSDLVTVHTVDYEVDVNSLTPENIMQVAEAYEIWGKGVPEPTFAITNIIIPAKEIVGYGDNNGFIKFQCNGLDFIKKYCKKTDYDEMTLWNRNMLGENKKVVNLTIIGTFSLNEFNGSRYPQIRIKHFYSEETEIEVKKKIKVDEIDDDFLF